MHPSCRLNWMIPTFTGECSTTWAMAHPLKTSTNIYRSPLLQLGSELRFKKFFSLPLISPTLFMLDPSWVIHTGAQDGNSICFHSTLPPSAEFRLPLLPPSFNVMLNLPVHYHCHHLSEFPRTKITRWWCHLVLTHLTMASEHKKANSFATRTPHW